MVQVEVLTRDLCPAYLAIQSVGISSPPGGLLLSSIEIQVFKLLPFLCGLDNKLSTPAPNLRPIWNLWPSLSKS